MFWLLIALIIDGIDGSLARLLRVKEVLPYMNGKLMDHLIDFVNYALIPAFMFYEAELVPEGWRLGLTFLILLVSLLYYGRDGMVTKDYYFVGFPVLWNIVMGYYIFVLDASPFMYILLTLLIAVLHFVPLKIAYPSQNLRFKLPTLLVAFVFILTFILLVYYSPDRPLWLLISAWATAGYFALLAVYITWFDKHQL